MDPNENARHYDASGRRESARQRRDHVIEIATALFSAHGFESTTFAQIAAEAGVSVAYLQGLGSKADLFQLALNHSATRGEGPLDGAAEELVAVVATLSPRESLDLVVSTTAHWNAGSHRLWRAWAQTSDHDLRVAWDDAMAHARREYRAWIEGLDARGARRTDVSIDEQTAGVWLYTMAETYDQLVSIAGLSHEQYVTWLRRSLAELVLGA